MKKTIKLFAAVVFAAMGIGCTQVEKFTSAPAVEVGEVTLNEDEASASVTVTPSSNTQELHWICAEEGGVEYENGSIGNEARTINLPGIKLDTEYTLTVWTKNKVGESQRIQKKFNFKAEEILAELVEIEKVYATSITMSVKVTKSVKCSRFVIGAQKKLQEVDITDAEGNVTGSEMRPLFDEKQFVEQAETSLRAFDEFKKGAEGDHFMMYAPYLVADKTDIYSDYDLAYAKYVDKPEAECAGLPVEAGETYVVAVYALDAQGEGKLYTMDYTAAEATEIRGTVDVKVEFLDVETSYTKVKARITAGADCDRLYYGTSVPDEYGGNGSRDMEEMSNSEFENLVLTLSLGRSHAYNGPVEVELRDNIEPGSRRVVWAIGIDKEGKVGKVERAYFTAPEYAPTGIGRFTSYDFVDGLNVTGLSEDANKDFVRITLGVDEETKAVRLLPLAPEDYSTFRNRIDYLLFLSQEDGGGMYTEYEAKDGKVVIDYKYYDKDRTENASYYFFAATVDKDGKLGKNENIVQKKYGWSTMYWEVPQISTEDDALTFTGKGAATIEFTENITSTWDGTVTKVSFNVTFGKDTKAVHYFKMPNRPAKPNVEAIISELCENRKSAVADEADVTLIESGSITKFNQFYNCYTETDGGDIAIFVSEDTDGNFKVVAVYYAGGILEATGETVKGHLETR